MYCQPGSNRRRNYSTIKTELRIISKAHKDLFEISSENFFVFCTRSTDLNSEAIVHIFCKIFDEWKRPLRFIFWCEERKGCYTFTESKTTTFEATYISKLTWRYNENGSWFLLHDNALLQKAVAVYKFLAKKSIITLDHPRIRLI